MIAHSNLRDDLDVVTTVHKPERVHITIDMPDEHTEMFWKSKTEKSSITPFAMSVAPSPAFFIPLILYCKRSETNKVKASYFDLNRTSWTYDLGMFGLINE